MFYLFVADPTNVEPPLASFAAMDERELGEGASMTVIKHLKEIKAQSVKHYGKENILGETEARETMLGVSFTFPNNFHLFIHRICDL